MRKMILNLIVLILITPNISFAHPGRTDASGCHTCRTNCSNWGLSTGEYHCHRSKGVVQPVEPVRSIRNENGIGKTVPAPEYKTPILNNENKTPNSSLVETKTLIQSPYVERPSLIKRFFNWLF